LLVYAFFSIELESNLLPFSFLQARILSVQYKALSEKELKKWTKKVEQDKIRYQEEMKHYIPIEEEGGKKKKAKKDPNAPKRNMSAYFLYSIFARPQVKSDHPEASFGDIARLISAQFKELSDQERKMWDKKAAEDKERYQKQMAAL
jgi:high mobility group protein B2